MGYLKFKSDLFLGESELNRLNYFLDDTGFRKLFLKNSVNFGLFQIEIGDGGFENFKISQGVNVGYIHNEEGWLVNHEGQIIHRAAQDALLQDNDQWYWLKVSHTYTQNEDYLVSVDASGNLSAPGGRLTEILRGLPNNPSVVKFINASLNLSEYQVVEVINDESAVLAGDFLAESNINLAVVGSHTPDIVVPSDSKYPFQYDSCTATLVLETVTNTPPILNQGEYLIARVKRNGSVISIEDKRSLNIYRSKEGFNLWNLSPTTNPLIGIESVKFNNTRSPKNSNIVYAAFGFRSSNWTFDSSVNRITLIGGLGGVFKDTSYFANGDFDGWRVYFKSGRYVIVKQSSIAALQINLIVDSLDPDELNDDLTQELHVVPNCEQVEIIARVPSGQSTLTEMKFIFPSNSGEVKFDLPVYAATSCMYEISYRYKSFKDYTDIELIPSDSIGYLRESAFNSDGELTGSTRFPYVDGLITLVESTDSYLNIVNTLNSGNVLGYEYLALDNADPVVDIIAGAKKTNIIVTQELDGELEQESDSDFDEGGIPYILTIDHYLNFPSDQPSTIKNGQEFIVQFRGTYTPGAFSINIVQDYVTSGNVGIILYTLTAADYDFAAEDNLLIKVFFDGRAWQAYPMRHVDDVTYIQGGTTNVIGNIVSSAKIKWLVLTIGPWDMVALSEYQLIHGIENLHEKLLFAKFKILSNGSTFTSSDYSNNLTVSTNVDLSFYIDSSDILADRITIARSSGGDYNSTAYNDSVMNRGIATICYLE